MQVLNEGLHLVGGQQERMIDGANVWNWVVSYNKAMGNTVERGVKRLPFSKSRARWYLTRATSKRISIRGKISEKTAPNWSPWQINNWSPSTPWTVKIRNRGDEARLNCCVAENFHDSMCSEISEKHNSRFWSTDSQRWKTIAFTQPKEIKYEQRGEWGRTGGLEAEPQKGQ